MSKIKEYSPIEAGLAELRNKYAVVHDVKTPDGYKQCKADAKAVGKFRTSLETLRKEIKGPALERCKDIDDEAKRIQAEIAKVEDPLKLAYKAIDEEKKKEEAERLAKIEAKIEAIRGYVEKSYNASSSELSEFIEEVDAVDCTRGFYELTKEALIVRNSTLDHLGELLKQKIQSEFQESKRIEQEKELEELRELKAKQDAESAKIEAAKREFEHEKTLAEQRKQAELDQAEAAKLAEERRLKDVAEATDAAKRIQEAKRLAEIEAQEKLESNKKHVGKVHREIKKQLMESLSIDEPEAKRIVLALLKIEQIVVIY